MKRIIKNPIFTFILELLIASSVIGTLSYSYKANDISYTTSHNNQISNVEAAINDLYVKANLKILLESTMIQIGRYNFIATVTPTAADTTSIRWCSSRKSGSI